MEQSEREREAVTAVLSETKGLGSTTASMPGTQVLGETVKEGMSLIDRFCAPRPRPPTSLSASPGPTAVYV